MEDLRERFPRGERTIKHLAAAVKHPRIPSAGVGFGVDVAGKTLVGGEIDAGQNRPDRQ
jgi:hypothetical protein